MVSRVKNISIPNGDRNLAEERKNIVLPFQIEPYALRGRLVRLSSAADLIISQHQYPNPINQLLAEMLVLAPCLASALKYEGVFTLQISGKGPVKTLMADVTSDGALRGYASYDSREFKKIKPIRNSKPSLHQLTGGGYIAFTVDQRKEGDRYQGIVELSGRTLADCTHAYFRNSEQIETVISIAASHSKENIWEASAIMIQRIAYGGGEQRFTGVDEADYEEGWRNAAIMMGSCKHSELLDRSLAPEQLLYRLFHETGVRVYSNQTIFAHCRCSSEKVQYILRSLTEPQLEEMKINGMIEVICEFCKKRRHYDDKTIKALREKTKN